jgi:hypothetical protein
LRKSWGKLLQSSSGRFPRRGLRPLAQEIREAAGAASARTEHAT